jgi:hypothetical protein
MTTRHDEVVSTRQIPRWIGTLPFGAPGRGGSVYGDGPAHSCPESNAGIAGHKRHMRRTTMRRDVNRVTSWRGET